MNTLYFLSSETTHQVNIEHEQDRYGKMQLIIDGGKIIIDDVILQHIFNDKVSFLGFVTMNEISSDMYNQLFYIIFK